MGRISFDMTLNTAVLRFNDYFAEYFNAAHKNKVFLKKIMTVCRNVSVGYMYISLTGTSSGLIDSSFPFTCEQTVGYEHTVFHIVWRQQLEARGTGVKWLVEGKSPVPKTINNWSPPEIFLQGSMHLSPISRYGHCLQTYRCSNL